MYNNLTLIQKGTYHYVDSRQVAELIGKQHRHLLRDIRNYSEIITKAGQSKVGLSDFFIESSFINTQNKIMPCYLISKMGCEIIANKLIGEKGVLFTVAYVSKFNEMEMHLRNEREVERIKNLIAEPTLSDRNDTAKIVIDQLKRTGASTIRILDFLKELYEPLGITVAEDDEFDNIPYTFTALQLARSYGVYSLYGNPHAQAVSCILNENLCIGDKHKIMVSENYETGITGGFRYDVFALESLGDWLCDYRYPSEIYGFDRTYHVCYPSDK